MKLSTKEVAEKLKISLRQVQTLIKNKRIPAVKLGRDWFVEEKDLELDSVKNRPITGRPKKDKNE